MGINLDLLYQVVRKFNFTEKDFLDFCNYCDEIIVGTELFDEIIGVVEQLFAEKFIMVE